MSKTKQNRAAGQGLEREVILKEERGVGESEKEKKGEGGRLNGRYKLTAVTFQFIRPKSPPPLPCLKPYPSWMILLRRSSAMAPKHRRSPTGKWWTR